MPRNTKYRYFIFDQLAGRWDESDADTYRFIQKEAQRMDADARLVRVRGDVYQRMRARYITSGNVKRKRPAHVLLEDITNDNEELLMTWAVVWVGAGDEAREIKRIEVVGNWKQRLLEWAEEAGFELRFV